MNIAIITPAPPGSKKGNRVTALRWARLMRQLGHRVMLREDYGGEDVDLLVVLHAVRGRQSVERFKARHPERPTVIAMSGTDLYQEISSSPETERSLALATRIVVLQPLAIGALPENLRARARTIVQSASAIPGVTKEQGSFDVCLLAHLRDVKDPLLATRAARLLPATSRARILHAGAALSPELSEAARVETQQNGRYRWLGLLGRQASLRLLGGSHLLVVTSRSEGGANVISEALAAGVPVLSTRIPGSVGILGEHYPGYFPVGDATALMRLVDRCERDPSFLADLAACCAERSPLVYPARERQAWSKLLNELLPPPATSAVIERGPGIDKSDLVNDVAAGLAARQKYLPCRYFYDQEGSLLFEAICELAEYDLLRRERALLRRHAIDIAARFPGGTELIEFGSGSAEKTRLLIEALCARGQVRYVPIDVSLSALEDCVQALGRRWPNLGIRAIADEYAAGFRVLSERAEWPRLVLYLGSNIGNLDRDDAAAFLRRIAAHLRPVDRVLVGVDLRRPANEHVAAYDDTFGITARFNRNLLRRINEELGADFRLDRFSHRAVFNEDEGRIEMYLDSKVKQTVDVTALGRSFDFAAGEAIFTESSYKYSLDQLDQLVSAANLGIDAQWSDGRFAVNLLRRT